MKDLVTIEADNLQRIYRENAELRVFVERLTEPEAWGWLIRDKAPEVFKVAVQLRKGWDKK